MFLKKSTLLLVTIAFLLSTTESHANINVYYESFLDKTEEKYSFVGKIPGGQFGASMVSGDFNGDGNSDLAVSEPFFTGEEGEWLGAVYIYLGGKKYTKQQPDKVIKGNFPGQQLGLELASGDFDSDGKDDLLISSYANKSGSNKKRGGVYVVYGSSLWNGRNVDAISGNPTITNHVDTDDGFGLSLHVADMNGDGVDDAFIGAPLLEEGRVFAYLGGNKKGLARDFAFVLKGEEKGDRFGNAITTADLDGDGRKEVVVGAYMAGVDEQGIVYIHSFEANYANTVKYILKIKGNDPNSWFGWSIDAGDINGDGKGDIAISTLPFKSVDLNGSVAVIFGYELLMDRSDTVRADVMTKVEYRDPLEGRILAYKLKIDDLNGDGFDDLMIGAPAISGNLKANNGNVYVVHGRENRVKNTRAIKYRDLDEVIYGIEDDDWMGSAIETLDFDGDGRLDLVVGARYQDGENSIDNGAVHLLLNKRDYFGEERYFDSSRDFVDRGEFVAMTMKKLNLVEKNSDYLAQCYEYLEFCLFNFITISRFKDLDLGENLKLYPDVVPGDLYYDDINKATMLGFINGYVYRDNTPFLPNEKISRIHALKVVLEASGLVKPLYEVEESEEPLVTRFKDIHWDVPGMRQYFRYVNFALDAGIIVRNDYFRPDDFLTKREAQSLLEKTEKYLQKISNEKTDI